MSKRRKKPEEGQSRKRSRAKKPKKDNAEAMNRIKCPECGARVKSKNYSSHLKRVHSISESVKTKNLRIANKFDEFDDRTSRKDDFILVSILIIIIGAIIGGYFIYDKYLKVVDYAGQLPINPNNQPSITPTDNEETPSQNPADNKKDAPDFSLQDANGITISLHDFKNKVVVLHFMQVLSDCQGSYFYKSDDRAEYDPSLSGYVSLTEIETIYQFEELKTISNNYSNSNIVIISIIVPPGCCGDPIKFSQDFKNNYTLGWYVASDTMQYDTWYKYIDYLPSDSNRVFMRDPTILVIDKEQHVVYDSGYTDATTLTSKLNPLL